MNLRCSRSWRKNFYINRGREKNEFRKTFLFWRGKTCPIVRAITWMTNQNYQTMLAYLLKKIISCSFNFSSFISRSSGLSWGIRKTNSSFNCKLYKQGRSKPKIMKSRESKSGLFMAWSTELIRELDQQACSVFKPTVMKYDLNNGPVVQQSYRFGPFNWIHN